MKRRPPVLAYLAKLACYIGRSYRCSNCLKWIPSSYWTDLGMKEPSVDLLWAGLMCLECFQAAEAKWKAQPKNERVERLIEYVGD